MLEFLKMIFPEIVFDPGHRAIRGGQVYVQGGHIQVHGPWVKIKKQLKNGYCSYDFWIFFTKILILQ